MNYQTLMSVANSRQYSTFRAEADYIQEKKAGITIYLHSTPIIYIDLINHSFNVTNAGWNTITTIKAITGWTNYLLSCGYKLEILHISNNSLDKINLTLRIPALAYRGGFNNMKSIICHHVGAANNALRSFPDDKMYLSLNNFQTQYMGCYMKGRNIKQIIENVKDKDCVEFLVYADNPIPNELYGLWPYQNEIYLFRFIPRVVAYHKDFVSANVTYTAVDIFQAEENFKNIVILAGAYDDASAIIDNFFDNFKRL